MTVRRGSILTVIALLVLALAACSRSASVPIDEAVEPPAPTPTATPTRSPDPVQAQPRPHPEPTRADREAAEPTPEPEPAPTATATQQQSPPPQPRSPAARGVRGAWVHLFDNTVKTSAGIDRLIGELRTAGANTLIVQVARRHDAYYRSDVLPRTTDPAVGDLDVLDAILRAAKPAGIRVEAWITVGPTWHGAYNSIPHPPGWVWTEHGPRAPEDRRWVTRARDGTWGDYLDPALPEVRAHVVAVAAEIASRYPVDAVHLDYIRYPGNEWGYHPRALERFRAETGRTDTPSTSDSEWSAWRRAQVTQIVREVTSAVHAARPGTDVTAATIAWGEGPHGGRTFAQTRAHNEALQDWARWVADGSLDAVYPMLYFRANQHGAWFNQWVTYTAGLGRSGQARVAAGVGSYLNPIPAAIDQLRRAEREVGGVVVYSWQQPSDGDRAGTLAAIRDLWRE